MKYQTVCNESLTLVELPMGYGFAFSDINGSILDLFSEIEMAEIIESGTTVDNMTTVNW